MSFVWFPSSSFFIFRANDVKTGTLIGVDKYGNKYYEDAKHYFFGEYDRAYLHFIFLLKCPQDF